MSRFGELLTIIMIDFIIERKLDPKLFCLDHSITRRKLKDYISVIRNALSDNDIYYIKIEYKRSENIYRCYINT